MDKTFIISVSAIIISFLTFYFTLYFSIIRDSRQIFLDLLKDYRSLEIGIAIQKLWTFYRDECDNNEEELIKKYKEKYEEEKNNQDQKNTLHHQRRFISNFYQQLAVLYCYNRNNRIIRFIDKVFNQYFDRMLLNVNLDIVIKIIFPIEKEAIPKITKTVKKTNLKPLEDLIDLYRKSKYYKPN